MNLESKMRGKAPIFDNWIEVIDNSGFDKSDKQNLKLVSKTKILIDYVKRWTYCM